METARARMRALAKGKLRQPTGKEKRLFDTLGEAGALIFDAPIEGRMYMVFVPEDEKDSFEGAYGDRTLAMKESVLRGSFGNALSVFLHEAAHPYGLDGSRILTDKLTEALAQVYEHRHELELFERRWNEILERFAEPDNSLDKQDSAASTEHPDVAAIEQRVRLLEAAAEELQRNAHPSRRLHGQAML